MSEPARQPGAPARAARAPSPADERRRDRPGERRNVVEEREHAERGTGSLLPFRASGSVASARSVERTSRSVAAPISTSPVAAACSSRAATLTGVAGDEGLAGTGDHLTGVHPDAHLQAEAATASRISIAARTARSASSSWTCGRPKTAIAASPTNFSTVPPCRSRIVRSSAWVARHEVPRGPPDRSARRAPWSRRGRRTRPSRSCGRRRPARLPAAIRTRSRTVHYPRSPTQEGRITREASISQPSCTSANRVCGPIGRHLHKRAIWPNHPPG